MNQLTRGSHVAKGFVEEEETFAVENGDNISGERATKLGSVEQKEECRSCTSGRTKRKGSLACLHRPARRPSQLLLTGQSVFPSDAVDSKDDFLRLLLVCIDLGSGVEL